MKETSLADINEMEDGMPIPQLFGLVKTVFERKSGEGEYGPWSFQDAILTDGSTDVRLKFKGMEDASSLEGKEITIRANKSKQHGLTGVVKVIEQFDGKTYHKVQLTNSCKIIVGLPNGAEEDDEIPMKFDDKGQAINDKIDKKAREIAESVRAGDYTTSKVYEGVSEARKHIMQSVNLYNLCVDAVDAVIKPNVTNMTAEMFQAAVGTLFIESSSRRTNDGVHWWSYVDKMPDANLKK